MPKGIISVWFQRLDKNEVFYLRGKSAIFEEEKPNVELKQ